MQEFIQQAMQKLGTTEDATRTATGGLLQLIQKQVGEGDFSKLTDKLPGAADLLGAASPDQGGASGMLGGLMSKAGGALGGKLGAAASVMGLFKQAGIDQDKVGGFLSMFVDFAKQKAGPDVVGQLLGKMPEIKKYLDT